jgi:RHS repeat-associated protein
MQSALSQAFSEPLLAAMPQLSEKLHQGVPSSNPALYLGHEVCKSTTALGLRAALHLERVKSRSTGKERDTESGNDYFGARYYASSMGRFMSPDWSQEPDPVPFADLENPQSLNLYGYTLNNPLTNRDSDGHSCDPDYSTTNANGDTVVHAGACHLDWWDLPGHAWVGFANLITAHSGAQAATGAGQMFYAYSSALPFAQIGVGLSAGAGLTSLGLEVGGKELLKDGTKAAAKKIIEDLPEGAQKASAKRAANAATSSETVSITKSADGTITVSRTRPGFDGSQTFTKTIDSAGNSKTVQTAVDASGRQVHYDPKN